MGWDDLPDLAQRLCRLCFVKGMKQYPAASFGFAKIRALLPGTSEEALHEALGECVSNHILKGTDAGYYFTKGGCEWAAQLQRKAAETTLAGLKAANPHGPPADRFPFLVHNPTGRRWTVANEFELQDISKDKGLRNEVIAHMAEVLADPTGYGKQRHGKERHLRYKHIWNKKYRLVWCPKRPGGHVEFVIFTHKEDHNYG